MEFLLSVIIEVRVRAQFSSFTIPKFELNLQTGQLKQKSNKKGGTAVKGEIIRKEEILSDAMTEVQLALDALRKSFKVLLL